MVRYEIDYICISTDGVGFLFTSFEHRYSDLLAAHVVILGFPHIYISNILGYFWI
jgi:hypothetical protein